MNESPFTIRKSESFFNRDRRKFHGACCSERLEFPRILDVSAPPVPIAEASPRSAPPDDRCS